MANQAISISEQEIDDILATVEKSLEQVPNLAKSSKSMMAQMHKDEVDGQPEEEPAPQIPSENNEGDAGSQDSGEASAPEASDAELAPEQQLEQEGSGEEQPLSDEELDQIYGGMPSEELERHYMAIRKFLEQHYGADEGEQGMEEPQAEIPEQNAKTEVGSQEVESDEMPHIPENVKKSGLPLPVKGGSIPKIPGAVKKSEDSQVARLQMEIENLRKASELQLKAFEVLTQPSRKAIVGIEYVKKNEAMEGQGDEDLSRLSKSDIDAKFKEIGPSKLSKSERDSFNNFMLYNEGKDKVIDILKTKRGSK